MVAQKGGNLAVAMVVAKVVELVLLLVAWMDKHLAVMTVVSKVS
jgi:hypothetical protein